MGSLRDGVVVDREALSWPVRFVFIVGIVTGLVTVLALVRRSWGMVGVNFHVYYLAAAAVVDGTRLYTVVAPGFPGLGYVYPPIVALVFVPFLLAGEWVVAFVAYSVLTVGAAVGVGVVVLAMAARRGVHLPRVDQGLVVGYCLAGSQMVSSLFFGNVNPWLALGFAGGVLALDRGSEGLAGLGVGLPAVVKVFPAGFGLYLLVRRSWRAVVAAVVVGVVVGGASLFLFGVDTHVAYLTEALLPRRRTGVFAGGLPPGAEYLTLRRPLSLVFPGHASLLGPIAVLVVAPVVYAVIRRVDPATRQGSLLVLHTVVVGVLLVVPSYQVYYVFALPSLVGLVLCVPAGRARDLIVVGTALGAMSFQYPDIVGGVAWLGPGRTVVRVILTVGTLPLYGLVVSLAGCLLATRTLEVSTVVRSR